MLFKVVIDTNIWISYFINARTDYLVSWIMDHHVEVYTSVEITDEIKEVLSRPKFKKQLSFPIKEFIDLHNKICTIQKITRHYNLAPDPDDNFLFDLCLKANAAFLITSDKKLLNHSPSFPLEIITFNEFRSRF